jgi:hypothetical protein
MAEPITTALIVGLAAGKFAEGAGGKAAEKLVEQLWGAIVKRFSGRKKVEEAIGAIEASKGQDPVATANLGRVLEGDMFEDDGFRVQIEAIVREIQAVEPERVQEMLVGIRTMGAIKGKDLSQKGGDVQRMLVDVVAGSIEVENLTQE